MRLPKFLVLDNVNLLLILPAVVETQPPTDFLHNHIIATTNTLKMGMMAKNIQLQVIMIILNMRIDNLMSMRTNLISSM